ncbi:hypothetical protein GWI33_009622, partial [Rhynchophorus ferrugineus]
MISVLEILDKANWSETDQGIRTWGWGQRN